MTFNLIDLRFIVDDVNLFMFSLTQILYGLNSSDKSLIFFSNWTCSNPLSISYFGFVISLFLIQ
jgi:hypothetical protein